MIFLKNKTHETARAAGPPRFRVTVLRAAALAPVAALALAAPAMAVVAAPPPPVTQVINPVSRAPVVVDGVFSGVGIGQSIAEWSDIAPLSFISGNPGPRIANVANPLADSFVYTGVAPGATAVDGNALYLMYDYHARTNPFSNGDILATISFPIATRSILLTSLSAQRTAAVAGEVPITVEVAMSASPGTFACQSDAGFSATLTCTVIDANGRRTPASNFGILGAAAFGHSLVRPLDVAHLLVELEVPILVDTPTPVFPFANNGVYSPAPKFWGASATDNAGDPPISSSIVSIDPLTGATTTTFAAVPEPAALSLFGMGILGAWLSRRRSARIVTREGDMHS